MTATSFAFPEAKCALMKIRILARAAERDSVDERCAHAWGLVSRTIARRDGGGAGKRLAKQFEYDSGQAHLLLS
jgi:hypothetical protein